ncbi:DUF4367 domain-containing protein [Ruminococcus sp.]|uniref:DUF4367 domain-containing protein n=1 Tax=Ruminococcus sp. TaxID=41978 RepID=UPI0025DD12D0|nr:DUF4367 domain-containing protein [Ruminococcus sp.]MBQ8966957.1 DUF4367 domain-containing protein [Ruminococcus sp.]
MECNDLFLRALEETYDDEFEDYMSSLEERYGCEHIFGTKHNKEMAKLIKRQRRPYFKLISSTGRRAACIIIAFIVMSASALSVKAIREAIFDFITNIFSDHNVVTTESETDIGYPTTIEEEYFISELPDGFEEMDKEKTDNSIDISYFRNDEYVFFTQYTKAAYEQTYDNERSEFNEYTDSDGEQYMVITNKSGITYIWDNGRYIFEITSNLDKEYTLKLCKSTKVKS